jgi:hypothetical protein
MHETDEGVGQQPKSDLGDAASAVQDKAVELQQQGRSKLGDVLDERTTQAGGQSRQVAGVLRTSSSQLRLKEGSNSVQVAGMTDAAAERVERFGVYLEQVSGDELLRDAEAFARRRPWMVAGMGLLAGLAASRFLKASAERRYTVTASGRAQQGSWAGNGGSTGSHGSYATGG